MLRIVHGTIVSWSSVRNVDRVIFRLPREQFGDVETMRRGLLGCQGIFRHPTDNVGINISLYPLRQTIVRIGFDMLTATCTYRILIL